MVCLERMETLVNLDRRATRVLRDTLDRSAFLDPEASRETLVSVELRETKVKKEKLVWRDRRATWA